MPRARPKPIRRPPSRPKTAPPPVTPGTAPSPGRGSLFIAAAALLVPVALCLSRLNLDLWYDEAYTIEAYVSLGFRGIVKTYDGPNNHVFYSLILRPFYLLSDSNVVLRLPSLLFSVTTLLLVWKLAARHVSSAAAVPAVLWLGLNQMFLNHTMQIRGYSLSMCLAAALFAYAVRRSIRCRWFVHGAAIAGMALLLFTLPTNLLFLAPLCAAALVNVWIARRRAGAVVSEAIRWASGATLAVLFYAPILRNILLQRRERDDWGEGVRTLVRVIDVASRDAPWLWIAAALGLLGWWLRVRRDRPPRFLVWPIALALAGFGPFLVQSAMRLQIPYDRVFCPVLPFWALTGGWLLWEILETLRRALPRPFPQAGAALIGGLVLAAALLPRVLTYPARLAAVRDESFAQDGYYCYYSADFYPSRVVACLHGILRKDRSYVVTWDRRGYYTLRHYFHRAGLPREWFNYDQAGRCLAEVYFVVPKLAVLEDVSEKCGAPREDLQQAEEIANLGFYHVFRVRRLVPVIHGSLPPPEQ